MARLTSEQRSKMTPSLRSKAKKYGLATIGESVEVCYLCDEPIDCKLPPGLPGSPEIDHKVPDSLGGPSVLSNLFLAHKSCNLQKLDRPYEIARREIMGAKRSTRVWL